MSGSPVFDKFPELVHTVDYLVEDLRILEEISRGVYTARMMYLAWVMDVIEDPMESDPKKVRGAAVRMSKALRQEVTEYRAALSEAIGSDAAIIVELLWDSTEDHDGVMDFAVGGDWLEMDEDTIDVMAAFVHDGMDILQSAYCAKLC